MTSEGSGTGMVVGTRDRSRNAHMQHSHVRRREDPCFEKQPRPEASNSLRLLTPLSSSRASSRPSCSSWRWGTPTERRASGGDQDGPSCVVLHSTARSTRTFEVGSKPTGTERGRSLHSAQSAICHPHPDGILIHHPICWVDCWTCYCRCLSPTADCNERDGIIGPSFPDPTSNATALSTSGPAHFPVPNGSQGSCHHEVLST